ncbi:MAG: hypothetical protein NC395_03000 [Prevotella sp.]|nr:hypothetical protein [Prevotella sp.]
MKMSKAFAALSAAVMAVSAVPAAEVSAYTVEGYYETLSPVASFSSVSELAEHIRSHNGTVTVRDPYTDEYLAFEDVESVWIPEGFSDYADSISSITFSQTCSSVTFDFSNGSCTLTAYSSQTAGKSRYDGIKAYNDKQKVNGRTVYRESGCFGSEYCWKQGGKYFNLSVNGNLGGFSYCSAEEYILPEYSSEGLRNIYGKLYYVQSDGSYYVGWKTVGSKKYFFGMDGAALTQNTVVGNVRYIFSEDGACGGKYTGWVRKDGYRYYYKNGMYVTGVNKISGATYTFGDNGILLY